VTRSEGVDAWQPRWLAMLVLVYTSLGVIVMRPIVDPDVFWHIRTGQWIVEHRAVPWLDPFTSYGVGRPWIAYNWLFEIVLYGLHRVMGFFGPLLYVVVLSVAITIAIQALIARYVHRFTRTCALTAIGLGAMGPLLMPRSYLVSILFFLIELYVLLAVRDDGRTRWLLILPPMFVLWANVHIQFIYGLMLLGLAMVDAGVDRLVPERFTGARVRSAPLRPLILATLACAAATLVTPYHVYLYESIIEIARQTGIYNWNVELMAMDFRQPANFLLLGLALGAAFALGRSARLDVFMTLLLIIGAMSAFRSRRDVWLVGVPALAIIARSAPGSVRTRVRLTWPRLAVVTAATLAIFVGLAVRRDLSPRGLESAIAAEYPAGAAQTVESRGYPGPLFNHYDWGGYLIWRLPQLPAMMDGRSNLHGDERIRRSISTWTGGREWATDPELAAAKLVIAPINHALTSLLRRDPRFNLTYEDDVAAVFVAQPVQTPR
jgi:hypothetical protein